MATLTHMIYKPGTSFSIVLVFTALSLLGWFFIPLLSVSLQPSNTKPSFSVVSRWANSSATIVEAQLTSKLEGGLNTLKGVKKISSVSSPGRAKIDIELDKFTDVAQLRLEISSIIRRLYPKLPDGVSYPTIKLSSTDEEEIKPLLIYTLHGPHDSFVLQQYAENNVKTALALIQGIEKISVYGGTGHQWQISYETETLNRLLLSPEDIQRALQLYFHQQSLGFVVEYSDSVQKQLSVKLGLKQKDKIDWNNIPIKKIEGKIIYLSSIAKIKRVKKEINSYFRIDGQNAINIVVYPESGSNAIKLAETIQSKIKNIKAGLPPFYVLSESYNSTEYVSTELEKIYQRTILTILILLVFVFLASLSFRYVMLIVLSLFTNISLSFILYYFLGIEIHLYSLAGITVSFGLIIDNSIVMADHLIYRKNLKVYTALLASTLTTLVSLVVVWFLPENIRLNLWDFALIIVVNLSVSLVVSLFYIPALLGIMPLKMGRTTLAYKRRKIVVKLNNYYGSIIGFLLKYRRLAVLLLILAFGLPVFMLPNKINEKGLMPEIYNKTLGNEWYVDNVKPYLNKYLGGSLRLFSFYVFENSYYSEPEETKLYVNAAMPKGATIEQLNNVFVEMEKFVGQFADQVNYLSKVQSPQYASMTISFKDLSLGNSFPYILKSQLIARSIDLGGVNWDVYGVGKGFSNRTGHNEMINFKVKMLGYNFDELECQAVKLKTKLEKHPRVQKVNISGSRRWWSNEKSYEYFLAFKAGKLDYESLGIYGIYDVFKNRSLQGINSLGLFTGKKYEMVEIKADNINSVDKWDILNNPVPGNNSKLTEFVSIEKGLEQQNIYKENQNYIRMVDFQYVGSSKFGSEFLKEVLEEMKYELPIGYSAEASRGNYRFEKETVSYALLILLITLIIYIICSILFESLLRPFAIILTVPASFIGVFLTFYLFDFNFDQGGYASFVLITGLVVNSAIYLLNEFDNTTKREKKLKDIKNYVKAFNRKIVPILLTISSTVLGLVPFVAFGQDEAFWFALAAGTIGGLVFSIFVIVVYLPLFVLKRRKV